MKFRKERWGGISCLVNYDGGFAAGDDECLAGLIGKSGGEFSRDTEVVPQGSIDLLVAPPPSAQ